MGKRDIGRRRRGENMRRDYGEERYRETDMGREYEEGLRGREI
jgi:hypothetical protein